MCHGDGAGAAGACCGGITAIGAVRNGSCGGELKRCGAAAVLAGLVAAAVGGAGSVVW